MEGTQEGAKQARGNKGDGSIQAMARGKWRVAVDFGVNPVTRKRERVTRVVNGTKADARKVRDQIKQEHENGLSFEGAKLTFSEFAATWHAARVDAGKVGEMTLRRERNQIALFNNYIGSTRLRDITPQAVESLYAAIRGDKIEARGKCSGTTMNQIHKLLKQIMGKAVTYDLVLRNPCERVDAPRCETPKRESLTLEESSRLLVCVDEVEAEEYAKTQEKESRQTARGNLFGRSCLRGLSNMGNTLAVRIGLATGMRRGEVFGLCWGSVDLHQSCIGVCQTLTATGKLKQPKGNEKDSVRTLSIDANTVEHLRQWKHRQGVELLKLGIKQGENTPVCCSDTGGFMGLDHFERWWRVFRSRFGYDTLKFHELRHTQATQLLANGVDVKTVQKRLGHASAMMTLDQYSHAIPENDRKAADLIGELFSARPKATPIIEVKTA
ncbi:MAG: site-specific integrase [Gordonibacter sp.]|nr:site-specific integrase [Gordonibacter sp.]